jgi:type I restriction-modification system DNA methylase subunit
MEKLSDLFGREWGEKRKTPSNTRIISLSEIANNNFNLSAKHYINKKPVTLRVDIRQELYQLLEKEAKNKDISLDEVTEEMVSYYIKKNQHV